MPDIQERTLEGSKITRVGRGHYLCKSRSRPSVAYSIDLEAHRGLGSCQCEDFIYRRLPKWKKVQANYDHFRCRHIRAVRNHVLDQIITHYQTNEDTD
jgi:hypothetical protein